MTVRVSVSEVDLGRGLRDRVHRRLRFALSRFEGRIQGIRVRLVDVNGPRGGVDTRCTVQVRLRRLPTIVVEETSHDADTAVDRAVNRVAHTVARRVERATSLRRRRQRAA